MQKGIIDFFLLFYRLFNLMAPAAADEVAAGGHPSSHLLQG
jgi:hypothetical protein